MIRTTQSTFSLPSGPSWTVLFLLTISTCACSSSNPSETGGGSAADHAATRPESQQPSNAEHLGVVLEPQVATLGDVNVSTAGIETSFTLQNPGNSEIQILRVESTCGCTVASPASATIAPHGETKILTTVKPTSPGPRNAAVRVFLTRVDSNAKGSVQLRLNWNAVSPISMTPDRIDAGRLLDSEVWNGSFSIATFDGSPINAIVNSIAASPATSIAIHTSLPKGSRDSITIDLSISGDAEVVAEHKGMVILKCREDIGVIHVPVVWKRVPKIYLEPAGSYKGQVSPGTEWHSTFTLNSTQSEVVEAEPSAEFRAGFQAGPLTKSVWQIAVAGIAPDSIGPFSVAVPIRIRLVDETERDLIFTATGVVR